MNLLSLASLAIAPHSHNAPCSCPFFRILKIFQHPKIFSGAVSHLFKKLFPSVSLIIGDAYVEYITYAAFAELDQAGGGARRLEFLGFRQSSMGLISQLITPFSYSRRGERQLYRQLSRVSHSFHLFTYWVIGYWLTTYYLNKL